MKINKQLSIGNEPQKLVSENINLQANWIGKARFVISSSQKVTGLVEYKAGYASFDTLHVVFLGVVDSCIEVAKNKWQVTAREYIGALDGHYPIAARHVTLNDVLAKISSVAGIQFVTPQQPYANTKIPYFYHIGTCTEQLQAIGLAFDIPDFVFYLQGDGKVFVGSYADSFWRGKTLDVEAHQALAIDGESITLPFLPATRPGVLINGKRIRSLSISGSQMVAQW